MNLYMINDGKTNNRPLPLALLCAALVLNGCSSLPKTTEEEAAAPLPSETTEEAKAPPAEIPEPPATPFKAETLYALLVAEFAGSREQYDIALGNYIQQAYKTRDPGVVARATRIARFLNARKAALSTAMLWIEIEPENPEARFIAASELTYNDRLLEATQQSNHLLELNSSPIYRSIAARALRATDTQRETLIAEFEKQVPAHPDDAELIVGLAMLYQQQEDYDKALSLVRTILEKDPQEIPAAVMEARLLDDQGKPDEAIQKLSSLLSEHPDDQSLRLQYARLLAGIDLEKAQQQFEQLVEESPGDGDLLFSLALISNERGQHDEAKQYFTELLKFDQHRSSAHFYLGRLAEQEEDWQTALENYVRVEPGPDYLPALLQTTQILVKAGELETAHERLDAARVAYPAKEERFFLLEAEVLSAHEHYENAVSVLEQAIAKFPESTQLLYSRAMISEQLGNNAQLEADLRQIIKFDPNNATALNALGYTLADRTTRYEEALDLISRALSIKPDDPAIIDSMGWVQYRLGNYEESLLRLREAMKAFPDHEIAAHLGEVLWVSGNQQEAESVWKRGLELNPNSAIIKETRSRLGADN